MKGSDVTAKVQKLVDFAYTNTQTSWYRDHCAAHGIFECPRITKVSDISNLPLMERTDLNAVSIKARAFRSLSKANEIRSTSGTTAQAPLFYMRDVLYKDISKRIYEAGGRRKLLLWNYHLSASYVHADHLCGIQTIVGDPHQLDKAAALVDALSVDILSGTPSMLMLLGPLLEPKGINHRIKFLDISGEPCRTPTTRALHSLYPNAQHYSSFVIGEVGQEIGIRTPHCTRQDGGYYHLNSKDIYIEAIDNELIITRFAVPTITPLIRYKTGDHIRWLGHDTCACGHEGVSFEMLGRVNVDFVRIAGVEIRQDEIEMIVARFKDNLTPYVATFVKDSIQDGTQTVHIDLQVFAIPHKQIDYDSLTKRLQEALLHSLKVSATTPLRDMTAAGLFAVPTITFLKKRPIQNKKPGIKLGTDMV